MGPPPIATDALLAHAAFVRSVARAALRGDDLADDAVQETYVAALEHGATRRGPLRPWLGGVAQRKAALLARGRANARRREQRAARPELVDSAADTVARAETARRVCDAVLGLGEPYRATLLLRFYDDLPPRDIAKRLGIPVETVRTRIKRGVAQLRAVLEEKEGRGWRAALLPLAASVGTRAAATGAGAVMAKKMTAALAVVALLGGAVWWTLRDNEAPGVEAQTQSPLAGTDTAAQPAAKSPALMGTPGNPSPAIDRTRDLHGVVVDADGKPIPGATLHALTLPWARVRILTSWERAFEEHPGPSATSHADGSFALRLVAGSRGFLRVSAPGYATQLLVSRRAGEKVRVTLSAAVTLTLKLEDGEGNPTPDVTIRCIRFPSKGDLFVDAQATSNAKGLAVFPGLPGSTEVFPIRDGGSFAPLKNTPIQLPASGPFTQTIKMVECKTITGRVIDQDDNPIPDARVGLDYVFFGAVQTNNDGEFEQPGWRASEGAQLHVVAPGFSRRVVTVGKQTHVDIQLTKGIVLMGRVVSPSGAPLQGVLVAAFYAQSGNSNAPMSNGDAVTDTTGNFEIDGLGYGQHTLVLQRVGLGRIVKAIAAMPGEPHNLGDIQMAPGARIDGTVMDAEGVPVVRAEIGLQGPGKVEAMGPSYGRREQAFTDDLGRFSFDDLSTGDYVVSRKNAPDTKTVRIEQPDIVSVHLGVESVSEWRVRVVDGRGDPMAMAVVQFNGASNSLGQATADEQGVARITTRDQPLQVTVLPPDRTQHFVKQSKWPKNQLQIEVTLDRAFPIYGQLRMAGHTPPAGAWVRAVRPDGKSANSVYTDGQGAFVIPLREGEGDVDLVVDGRVRGNGPEGRNLIEHRLFEGRLNDVAPGSRGVTIELHRTPNDQQVTFVVVDDEGRPVKGAAVGVTGSGGKKDRLGATDASGELTLSNLAARSTRFVIYPPPLRGSMSSTFTRLIPNGQRERIELPTLVFIEGLVFDPSGEPAEGAQVSVDGERPGLHYAIRTSPMGEFRLYAPRTAFPLTLKAVRVLKKLEPTHEGMLELTEAPTGKVRIDLRDKR